LDGKLRATFRTYPSPKVEGLIDVRRGPLRALQGFIVRCTCGPLQCVNEERRDVEAGLVGDFLKAGRTGDIDLSDGITNYIKPNE
jgi:hypothetical protein